MTIKYSASNHACYLDGLNYASVPDDVVEITSEDHKVFTGETLPPEGQRLRKSTYPFEWETDPNHVTSLELTRQSKIDELRAVCGVKIEAGVETDVIHGYAVHYRLKLEDQLKIDAAASKTAGGKVWRNEIFEYLTQANAQTLQGLKDSHIESITTTWSDKYAYLVHSSRTEAEIDAVTWTSVE